MSAPGVAVVIPCHDDGATLEEALASVLGQTRPPAEVVIADDGSTDPRTRQALASLERRGILVLRNARVGPGAARNAGIRATTAPYVVTLDADDVLEPEYVERTAARLDGDDGLMFVSTALRAFGAAAGIRPAPAADMKTAIARGTFTSAATFRRSLWSAVGGFDEDLPVCEDVDFWISALERGFRGESLSEPLVRSRVRVRSVRNRAIARGTLHAAIERVLRKHREAIERIGPAVLLEKECHILDLHAEVKALDHERREAERALASLNDEIATLARAVRDAGDEPLDLGDLRRVAPLSRLWGLERGGPLDRRYIESFLGRHRVDVRGRVLEIKDPYYTSVFGDDRVTESEVLDVDPENPRATLFGDLTREGSVPSARYDCVLLTQTLHLIYDARAALANVLRALKPGGVLLCTLPAVSRVDYNDDGLDDGDSWRFTESSVRRLFAEFLPPESFEVTTYGNVLACAAFLYGLAPHELHAAELDASDPAFPLVFGVRAVKPREADAPAVITRRSRGAILMYHRVASLAPDTHGLCVPAAQFREEMRLLAREYRPMPLEELARAAAEGAIPDRAVAVTLDDGGLDGLRTASPILVETGVPATFFVNTEGLDEPREAWWDVLERIFANGSVLPSELELVAAGERLRLRTATAADRAAAHDALHGPLLRAALVEREELLRRLRDWSGLDLAPRLTHRPMLADEVRRLAAAPAHAIGSHTVHHLDLTQQPREAKAFEVRESKRRLEEVLGMPVSSFSYPYGEHDDETVAAVAEASYTTAVTVDPRAVAPGDPPLRLPRLEVRPGGIEAFGERLRAIFEGVAS